MIAWRKFMAGLTREGSTKDAITTVQHIQGIDATNNALLRWLIANDSRPVLTLTQNGTGYNLLLEAGTPEIRLAETDQTDPVGRWRFKVNGSVFSIEKSLSASWATSTPIINVSDTLSISHWDNDGQVYIRGGLPASVGGEIRLAGIDNAYNGSISFLTSNAAENALVTRLTLTGDAGNATAIWNATYHRNLYLYDLFFGGAYLTISGGAVTATMGYHIIDTQNSASTDDLDTISGGSAGEMIIIKARHTDRTVVVKHGTGNISLKAGVDISLDDNKKTLLLFLNDAGVWADLGGGNTISAFLEDTPTNGETNKAPTSNWAYDHEAAADPHTGYMLENAPSIAIVSKTGSYTAAGSDCAILCDASGGAFSVVLPASSGISGRLYIVKKTDSSANAVTVDGNAAETIDGSATATLTTQYESISLVSDGSNWHLT